MWGVASNKRLKSLEHVEFTIYIKDNEEFVYHRLLREKRNGVVEKINENTYVFKIDVYDTNELIPWIRTFLSRITKLNFSNRSIENQFKKDIETKYQMYAIDGGKG